MSPLRLILQCALGYLLACAIYRLYKIRQALGQISYYSGERSIFGISSLMGNVLPYIPYVSLGRNYPWLAKHQVSKRQGTGICGLASVFPPTSYFLVSDPAGVKHVSYSRNNFVKDTDAYTILKGFGSNLLVVEGEEWKRQRRIAAPAFSDKNNRLVWDTAKQFIQQMIDGWESKKSIIIHDVNEDLSLPLSLGVIAKAGFGQDISLGADFIPIGHQLTFKDALSTVSKTMHLPLMLPNWAWGLRKEWRHARQAHNELRLYLRELIKARRELKQQQIEELLDNKYDLFNQLVHARDANDVLSEEELIGNVFIFMIAGHETTAHTFAVILALLALYPNVQDKLAKQLQELEQEHGALSYSHIHLLTYAMAIVYEALRLFPMVGIMPKIATADTSITVGFPPHTQTIQVPESTKVNVFSTGLHYNPSYWESPDEFDPERFMDPHWNRDAFIAFSLGPRACIGRRFAETTLVAELAALISKYEVSIDESRFKSIEGESIVDRRSRLIDPDLRLTLSPAPASLIFSRRD
ncbi:cytochrome P450 [Rhizoctonia solani]|nr:cytochrome P450 [Rhizoctonia solani]